MEDNKSLPVFEDSYFRKIKDYIKYYKIFEEKEKGELINELKSLKDKNNFIESVIR